MQGLFIVVLVLHLLISALLIVVVLIQQRTKGGMAGVFGGGGGGGLGGAEQIFGSSGVAPFITRITAILGAAFMVTTLALLLIPTGAASSSSKPLINRPQSAQTTGQAQGQGQVNESQTQPGLVIPTDSGAKGGN